MENVLYGIWNTLSWKRSGPIDLGVLWKMFQNRATQLTIRSKCTYFRVLILQIVDNNRQKIESQNGGNKKAKHAWYVTPWYVRNVRFFGKFSVLCFLVTSVLKFGFLSYYRRNVLFWCMIWNTHKREKEFWSKYL